MKQTLLLFATTLLFAILSYAQPTAITWQGKLLDNSGNAINQNNVTMTFAMFDAETGGNQLWPASGVVAKAVNVVNGLYSVQLGTGTGDDIAFTAAMFDGKTPWLEVKVGTETLPRTEITTVPFALISNDLSAAAWETPGEIGKTTPNTGKFTSVETGSVKITDGAADGEVLTSDADGNASWETPYTGLTNFTESNYTYDSRSGVKFTPDNAAANVDFVLQRKGTGAILAQQPEGTKEGGNKRGNFAVDLQTERTSATQVASGLLSVIVGGYGNTASAGTSTAMGAYTTASGPSSTAMGYYTTASGTGSTAMGLYSNASGANSTTMGAYTTAPSAYETVTGRYNTIYSPVTATGWENSDRLFVVGNGISDGSRSNAFTILKNAFATIGGSLTVNGNGANTSYTFPETRGTSGQVLQTDGSGTTIWETPYTGLTNFTESNFTYDSRTGVKFTPNNAATDVDLVLSPKGSGAIIAQQPGGTTEGGNKRGNNAVDLQSFRINASQVASGNYAAIVGGAFNTASGIGSIAMGIGTKASGENSTTMGSYTTASGVLSTAMGTQTTASGTFSTAMGEATVASGQHSVALGSHSTASNNISFAMGSGTNASGNTSTAIGISTTASGYGSFSSGLFTQASGDFSIAAGFYTTAPSTYETAIGRYSTTYTPNSSTEWNSTDRIFVVGNGTADGSRSNALTILKNANTTIGGSLTLNGNGTGTSFAFPATRGASGQFLKTAGDGTTSWSAVSKSDVGLGNVENTAISTWAGSSNITTLGTIATGTWSGTTIALTKGGTGAITKTGAFDALSPMTMLGDIIYGGTSGTGTRLGKGTAGQVLTMNAGATAPQWSTPSNGTVTSVSGTAPISVATGTTTPAISIAPATASAAGSMSSADKTKLDAISGTNTGDQTITLTSDVTGSGNGSFAATIASAAVTNPKMAAMGQNSIKANATGSLASPSDFPVTANTFPARSSTGNLSAKTISDFAFTVLDDADAASVRTTIGAGTGNGNGTVTNVSGTAPISVTNGTSTPAISISVATASAAGSMSSADKTKLDAISGTNTGDQTITLTGDVTGSGNGSFAATIASAAVTNPKMAAMGQNSIKANATSSLASPSDFPVTANTFPARSSTGNLSAKAITDFAFTILDDADAASVRTTLGAGTVTGVTGTAPIVSSGGTAPAISISSATPSAAGSMSAADKTKLDGINGSETKVSAGTNVSVTGTGTSSSPYVINATAHTIGESYGGGIVFWVDDTGQHGLIAAIADQSTGLKWNFEGYQATYATRDGIGAGMINTERIFEKHGYYLYSYAAQICRDYQGGGYGDWYLPSKYELNLLYLQKNEVGGFTGNDYWSSNETVDSADAWVQSFSTGAQNVSNMYILNFVRAIRSF